MHPVPCWERVPRALTASVAMHQWFLFDCGEPHLHYVYGGICVPSAWCWPTPVSDWLLQPEWGNELYGK